MSASQNELQKRKPTLETESWENKKEVSKNQ